MSKIKQFFLILALMALWSPSFLFIKMTVTEIPPITTAAMRVTLAAVLLCALLLYKRQPLPKNKEFWGHIGVMSLFASILPFSLFCYAEQTIDSALAAILNGTTPMFTAMLAHQFIPSDRMTLQKGVGITFSVVGVLLLFAPNILSGFSGNALGMVAALLAAICYSVSHIYGKKYTLGQKPYVAPASQLIFSALVLLPVALWYDDPLSLPTPSINAFVGISGLTIFGTFLAFIVYYKLLETAGPTAVSMVACFFPVGGMVLGFLFLGETFTIGSIFASALILIGLLFVNGLIPLKSTAEEAKV